MFGVSGSQLNSKEFIGFSSVTVSIDNIFIYSLPTYIYLCVFGLVWLVVLLSFFRFRGGWTCNFVFGCVWRENS